MEFEKSLMDGYLHHMNEENEIIETHSISENEIRSLLNFLILKGWHPQSGETPTQFLTKLEWLPKYTFEVRYQQRRGSQTFYKLLEDIAKLHEKKNQDYASDKNPFSNFEETALYANVSVLEVFNVMLGIKESRLRNLISNNKSPNNESINDTYLDDIIYRLLRLAYIIDNNVQFKSDK